MFFEDFDVLHTQKKKKMSDADVSFSDSDEDEELFVLNVRNDNIVTAIPVPVETTSFLCLGSCAIWALYNCTNQLNVYPYFACIVILGYAIMGIFRKKSMLFEDMFEISRVIASIVPMAAMNAHMLRCNPDLSKRCNDFTVIISLAALPFILKRANPQRTESIVDIVVWSNICTLGFKAIERDFHLGMIITFWQGFYYLLSVNSHQWLLTDPEIPFNLGLSGSCILFCHLYSCSTSKIQESVVK